MSVLAVAGAGLVLVALVAGGWRIRQLDHENAGFDRDLAALEKQVASLQSAQAGQVIEERERARATEGLFRRLDESLQLLGRRQANLERALEHGGHRSGGGA